MSRISYEPLKSREINMKKMAVIAFCLMLIFKPCDQVLQLTIYFLIRIFSNYNSFLLQRKNDLFQGVLY
jgi:hypothetical protein